ncbi:MAG: acyl CoA:acetate/3-ketoacid CoA transferase, partial [Burkholderiales bacterium]
INISQNTKIVVFVGTFSAGAQELRLEEGGLRIAKDGGSKKFVAEVEQRTFSGAEALRRGQRVLYVTERCVFRLVADEAGQSALELIELAPGVDLRTDVLDRMGFAPRIANDLKPMDARLFQPESLGLRERLLNRTLAERFELDRARRLLHIDFSGLRIGLPAMIRLIDHEVRALLTPFGQRVDVIVNYDNFSIAPELEDEYTAMVEQLTTDHYGHVTRYATGGFVKSRLGNAARKG